MLLAYRCTLVQPLVSAAAVEASEFPADADRHGVLAVPAVVVDGRQRWSGSVAERVFVERLVACAADGAP